MSQRLFAADLANHLFGAIGPVSCDGQFHRALIVCKFSPQNCRVLFLNLPTLELSRERRETDFMLGYDHNSRGIQV